jgi:hypothetical protein
MKVSASQKSVTVPDPKIATKVFDLPGVSGRVLVLVNTDIGTWPGNSVASLSENRTDIPFIIDGLGTLVGYQPKTAPAQVGFTTTLSGTPYEISSGSPITGRSVSLKPGEGMFVFIGSAAELTEIRTNSGMGRRVAPCTSSLPQIPSSGLRRRLQCSLLGQRASPLRLLCNRKRGDHRRDGRCTPVHLQDRL